MAEVELNFVLIGNARCGKSTTGNAILNKKVFYVSSSRGSATIAVDYSSRQFGRYLLQVVDIPRILDREMGIYLSETKSISNMERALEICPGGVDAFLLVLKFPCHFTAEDSFMLKTVKKIFGDRFFSHVIVVVLTYGDLFEATMIDEGCSDNFEKWCGKQVGEFRQLYDDCEGRCVLFNNIGKNLGKTLEGTETLVHLAHSLQEDRGRYTVSDFKTVQTCPGNIEHQNLSTLDNHNRMDLQELNKLLKIRLAHLLLSIPESKDLVLDSDLTKPLDRVAGISFLKEHGVDKIFKLEPGQKSLPGCGKRIYLVRPRMVTVKYIADHINNEMAKGEKRLYKIVMVPRKLSVCEMILESEGVMGHITIDEFPLELFPLDSDILSLESPELFSSFYLDNDTTWLQTVASSLVSLQGLFGKIPNVYTIGKGSKMVYDLMQTMFETHKERKDTKYHIGQLFIMDREIDLVSPLCSPMTYEALLNETFGIDCSMITFDSAVTGDSKEFKMLLTSQDEIYSQIRDRHFSHVFSYLSGKAKDLQAIYSKKNNLKTVGDMKEYVANELRILKHQQKLLATHIGACEVIMKTKGKTDFEEFLRTEHSLLEGTDTKENVAYIEECIHKQFSAILTLRLMCLLSLTQEGLTPKDYKSLKTQFLHSHGFEHLVTFFNLKKLGMLTEQEVVQGGVRSIRPPSFARKTNYITLNRKLGLVPKQSEEFDVKNPSDMSYVFSGAYSPLPCKLVEQIITRDSLVGLEDIGRMCGGIHSDLKVKNRGIGTGKAAPVLDPAMRVVLVYFVGGCTFSEISALRFIAKYHGIKIIVATTSIITSNSLLDSLLEKAAR